MPPLAPVINQLVPTTDPPAAIGTSVAQIVPDPGEVDPGPFTYAITQDPGSAFSLLNDLIQAAIVLDGAFFVAVTSTSAGGTSPEGSATLTFADNQNPWDDAPDPYEGNAQLPPPTPDTERWRFFLRQAVLTIVPRARFGIDFMVARQAGKSSGQDVIDWDTALLGAYPQTAVEDYAQQLAAAWPWSEPLP